MRIFLAIAAVSIFIISAGSLSARDDENDKWNIVPIIAPYYTPDTGVGLGAYIVTSYKNEINGDFDTPDEFTFYTQCTQKKQFTLGLENEIFLGGGKFKLSGSGEFNKDLSSFWGIGPDTAAKAEENYRSKDLWCDLAFQYCFIDGLYIGPALHMMHSVVKYKKKNGLLRESDIPGKNGLNEVGAGLSVQFDTRNSIFYPTEGIYLKARSIFQRDEVLSEFSYSKHTLDGSYYYGITGDHVLALQVTSGYTFGTVPLQSLCGIGGDMMMRGLLENRYIDKSSIAVQAEYRFPLVWRIAGVLFAGTGEVQNSLPEYNIGDLHYTGGGGLRFILDTDEHINARLDVGYNDNGDLNIYILAKEAF